MATSIMRRVSRMTVLASALIVGVAVAGNAVNADLAMSPFVNGQMDAAEAVLVSAMANALLSVSVVSAELGPNLAEHMGAPNKMTAPKMPALPPLGSFPPPGSKGSQCKPLRSFLTDSYQLSWSMAMLEPSAVRAFSIYTDARQKAAAYVKAHPKTPDTVCGVPAMAAASFRKALEIITAHRRRNGSLPPGGRFRKMTKAEVAAMNKVLAVPILKPLPARLLPKKVAQ